MAWTRSSRAHSSSYKEAKSSRLKLVSSGWSSEKNSGSRSNLAQMQRQNNAVLGKQSPDLIAELHTAADQRLRMRCSACDRLLVLSGWIERRRLNQMI
jgi:hypothetical protein